MFLYFFSPVPSYPFQWRGTGERKVEEPIQEGKKRNFVTATRKLVDLRIENVQKSTLFDCIYLPLFTSLYISPLACFPSVRQDLRQ